MKILVYKFKFGIIALAICLSVPVQTLNAQSSNSHESLEQERVARQFLALISSKTNFSDDLLINQHITKLARELAKNSELDKKTLHYFVLNDPNVNAFAGIGATFFVNTGLIELARTEGELASVIAHELAHYKQRHLDRLFQNYEATKLPLLLTVLAGIVVGGDVGAAAMTTAVAAQRESIIDHTLSYEREADAIGLQILTSAGYRPEHAANFMLALERHYRESGITQTNIHNTHPVTPERVASIKSRISRYPEGPDKQITIDFFLVQARAKVQYNWEAGRTYKYFEQQLQSNDPYRKTAAQYGYALSVAKDGDKNSAVKIIDKLRESYPNNIWYLLAAAEVELNDNNPQVAVNLLDDYADRMTKIAAFVELYGLALIRSGKPHEAYQYIRQALILDSKQTELYPLLSKAAATSGDQLNTYLAQSEFNFLRGKLELSLKHLENAEKYSDGFYTSEVIREKKRLIREELDWRNY